MVLALLHVAALLATTGVAHFIVQSPKSIGFGDREQGVAPCGGFAIESRKPVIDFPVKGMSISILSTHIVSTWEFRAMLLSDPDPDKALNLLPPIEQSGVGDFCLPQLRGPVEWIGKDGVIQILQHAVDGTLYQCLAVKYTDGDALAKATGCKNTTINADET